MIVLPNPVNNKRLPTRLDSTYDILYYGVSNLYPQEHEQIRLASPLIKSASEILEDFINGSGWENDNEKVMNEDGETARDLLNLVAMDYSRYNGFAIHVEHNALGGITAMAHIPFEYVRLGLPDEKGKVRTVVVSNNWEKDPSKLPQRGVVLTTKYPIYNPLTAGSDLFFGDGRGQVLYFSGLEKNKYPLCTYDSITMTGESDEAIQNYERNNIKRGFHGATIFKYPGKFESDEEKLEIKKLVEAWNGEDSPGVTVAQVDEDFSGELLETITSNSDDTLFQTTLTSITDRVLQTFKIPPALLGISPQGGVFTQLAYQESFTVYNVITRNRRNSVERVFEKLTSNWADGPFSLGRILENEFAVQTTGQEAPGGTSGAPESIITDFLASNTPGSPDSLNVA